MKTIWNDAAEPWQLGFQDSSSKTMEGINLLHDSIIMYVTVLLVLIGWILIISLKGDKLIFKISHGTVIEFLWTITPAFILVAIAFPSLRLLYLTDSVIDPAITIKLIAHQWYWSAPFNRFFGSKLSLPHLLLKCVK